MFIVGASRELSSQGSLPTPGIQLNDKVESQIELALCEASDPRAWISARHFEHVTASSRITQLAHLMSMGRGLEKHSAETRPR
jgi:hypothetical protein